MEFGFRYDNIVMEESAQILEVETFIPLMLQTPEDGYSRLKRVVLIGDHHQVRSRRLWRLVSVWLASVSRCPPSFFLFSSSTAASGHQE